MMKRILLFYFLFLPHFPLKPVFLIKTGFLTCDEPFQFSAAKARIKKNVIVNWSIAEVLSLYQENFREA